MEFLLLLSTPLSGALLLGVFGARRWAAGSECRGQPRDIPRRLCAHRARRERGPSPGGARAVLHRSLQRLSGHAHRLRRTHHLDFLAPLHARGDRSRARERAAAASLPQHVSALHDDHADCAHDQQHGAPVGRDGSGDALHGAAGHAVPDGGESGGRLEVLHPLRRRHRPGTLRHDPPVLRRREDPRCGRGDARSCGRT